VAEQLFARCRFLSQEVRKITLVFDKGNNSEDNLKLVDQSGVHFIGSLVPTQHSDLLATLAPPCIDWTDRSLLRCGLIALTKWFLV
jgi:hypothetical protein